MVVVEVMVGTAASAAKVEAGEVEAEGVEAEEVRKAVRVAGWGPGAGGPPAPPTPCLFPTWDRL